MRFKMSQVTNMNQSPYNFFQNYLLIGILAIFALTFSQCSGSAKTGIFNGETESYTYYLDADGDTYGDPDASLSSDEDAAPDGYVDNDSDCDDTDSSVNPEAEDSYEDGIDQNCDDNDGEDGVNEVTADISGMAFDGVKSAVYLTHEDMLYIYLADTLVDCDNLFEPDEETTYVMIGVYYADNTIDLDVDTWMATFTFDTSGEMTDSYYTSDGVAEFTSEESPFAGTFSADFADSDGVDIGTIDVTFEAATECDTFF